MLIKKQVGFTLVEMAVVLVIVGLLAGSFIGTFVSRVDTTRRADTKSELQIIKQVLIAYAYTRGVRVYLPCPDTTVPPDGLEDRLLGVCIPMLDGMQIGSLPWVTLGMGREDDWASHYRYWVNYEYATDTGFDFTTVDDTAPPPLAPLPAPLPPMNASVQTRVNDVNTNMVENAVAVIFSPGKNTFGGISVEGDNRPPIPAANIDETENNDGDLTYIARLPSEVGSASAGGVFDDILVWINSYEVKARMVEAGKLP